jgi:hypothetical protein
MIDGVYSLEISLGREHIGEVAMVKGNVIRGLVSGRIYVVEFSGRYEESC